MLFEIRPNLEQSKVFDGLNKFLIEVMLATLEGREVDETNLPAGLCVAISENEPSQTAVASLVAALLALSEGQMQALRSTLALNASPCIFLSDLAAPLPAIPENVFSALKTLAVHLFGRTAKLKAVELACGECIDDHYARFRKNDIPGNGNLCCVCGTEPLAQIRAGVNESEQWRGPYDHLLAKDRYPLFGVHPKNLLPICVTCNAKAKLVKDLLLNEHGNRRLSFSPWTEHAALAEIRVLVDDTDELFPRVVVEFMSAEPDRQEKLNTWDEVFNIKSRIEGEFQSLKEKISEDARASNDEEFLARLEEQARARKTKERLTPFNYWRARVYAAICTMPLASREALRMVVGPPLEADPEMDALFGL